jgi:hypothetical protein
VSIMLEIEDRLEAASNENQSEPMTRGRVCCRVGCGKELLTSEGKPDYSRQFCGRECRLADLREQQRIKRAEFKGGKCPLCGRQSPRRQMPDQAVSYDPSVASNTSQGCVARIGGVVGVLRLG